VAHRSNCRTSATSWSKIAVEDARAPLGVTIDELPMTPERLATLVEAARAR
jgi:hypothetical protein